MRASRSAVFKTASFKIHNPSRHKAAALKYALVRYHDTLRAVIGRALADSGLESQIIVKNDSGEPVRLDKAGLGRYLYGATPQRLPISPLRDYLVSDAAAMLASYYQKRVRGDALARPPAMRSLGAPGEGGVAEAMRDFTTRIEWPVKSQQEGKISKARARGEPRVARRLEAIYKSWAATKAAGAMLRGTEPALPHPLQFERCEFERGFLLARRGDKYYCLVRLFSARSRYAEPRALEPGFIDLRTGELLDGKEFPGLILPLELGRDHHEAEFIRHGRPKSAKLMLRREAGGNEAFYLNVSFEFTPERIPTTTFLGIDRGAAMIGAATVVDGKGAVLARSFLKGDAFSAEMRRYEGAIAEAQRKGRRRFNFRVRGRRADIVVGEYANALIRLACEHKSQIVIEKLDARSMALFLRQSQVRKLYAALAYKAERAGLPAPVEVPAAFTSQTCARCAHKDRGNRPRVDAGGEGIQDVFCCVDCGYKVNADENAGEIIALRGLHQLSRRGGAPGRKARFQRFAAFQDWLKGLRERLPSQGSGASPA